MSKTIKEWLSELDSPYREQALENMIPQRADRIHITLKGALAHAFAWDQSKEGNIYWHSLYNSL